MFPEILAGETEAAVEIAQLGAPAGADAVGEDIVLQRDRRSGARGRDRDGVGGEAEARNGRGCLQRVWTHRFLLEAAASGNADLQVLQRMGRPVAAEGPHYNAADDVLAIIRIKITVNLTVRDR